MLCLWVTQRLLWAPSPSCRPGPGGGHRACLGPEVLPLAMLTSKDHRARGGPPWSLVCSWNSRHTGTTLPSPREGRVRARRESQWRSSMGHRQRSTAGSATG